MQAVRTTASLRKAVRAKIHGGRSTAIPWILFLLLGVPLGLMAALIPLSMGGYYVEPLRPFWQPWPPDLMKPFIGAAIFTATLAFLAYRSGRIKGFHSGTVAASVALRNMAEGRGVGAEGVIVPPPPPVLESRPPSPESPVEPASPPGAS